MLRNMAQEFPGARGYLNTASMGLPPGIAADELRTAIDTWQRGRASAPEYDASIDEARALFAELVNVSPDSVAIGSQVSALVGMVAAGLPQGSRVVAQRLSQMECERGRTRGCTGVAIALPHHVVD